MREPAFWHRPPSWTSLLLRPLAALYGAVAAHRLERQGLDPGIPVICVGNYHVGGAGKTPTVLALTALLRDLGERPVVLSRGYGGRLQGPVMVEPARHSAADVGDEPLMMAARVPVAVARERVEGVVLAKSRGATVILMDDGFQNPAIAKDVALIVIGSGHASDAVASAITAAGKPVLSARLQPEPDIVAALQAKPVLAFAGIGDPQRFFRTLRASGLTVAGERVFADHHPFTVAEIEALVAEAKQQSLTLVTTEKDLARLRDGADLPAVARDIVAFPVTLQFDDVAGLLSLLSARLFAARQRQIGRDR